MNKKAEELEKEIEVLRKINRVLMERVERSIDMSSGDFALFEYNIHLQKFIDERTSELENANKALAELNENQRRMMSELSERERIYATLIENLPGFVYRCRNDRDWTMEYISAACHPVTGYQPEDFIHNKTVSFNNIIRSDYRESLWNIWQEKLSKQEPVQVEYPIICADGSQRWVWERGRGVFNEKGELLFLEGFITDITEMKKAEEEREKIQLQLNQALKMESIGRLAGGVAHDFNNMLSVIIGYTEMLLNAGNPNDAAITPLKEIMKAAQHSADLTRQLLGFARRQAIAPRCVDLNEMVSATLKMLRRLIGENITLNWLPYADPCTINIDPSQIEQILTNLCINARDAISGTGKITIETRIIATTEEQVSPDAVPPGVYVMLAVSDDGSGMSSEILEHVFEPFYTTKTKDRGTGLGLAMVYGIVKQNNGFVYVYSEPGLGTTFKIYFPYTSNQMSELERHVDRKPGASRNETILLVEDEPALLGLIQKMLNGLGYRIIASGSPSDALRRVKEDSSPIHLLITDVVMPEMNGQTLAKIIQGMRPNVKVLFMSGYTANAIAHQGILEKGIYFIQKPFTIAEIAAKVRGILGK